MSRFVFRCLGLSRVESREIAISYKILIWNDKSLYNANKKGETNND